MSRPTLLNPERGDARTRLLEAARDLIRLQGFAATSVDDLCREAGVTKGAFFHHFKSKSALGIAAAQFWHDTTSVFFAEAPYHAPATALERVLAYVAFRRQIIAGEIAQFSCLAGTLVQEVHATAPEISRAAGEAILCHAATLETDIAEAMAEHGLSDTDFTAASLARHTQSVLQGAFIIAKAGNDPDFARESLDHLARYIRRLFDQPDPQETN
ncbi:TetR/AcrR family transcriptional regulator [Devosia sp.]|uniref:TetR/AcrR family transcriptional regulator n=1 Tax=Devosia sp. TaxID=1871048 RepID=UPI003A8FCBD5